MSAPATAVSIRTVLNRKLCVFFSVRHVRTLQIPQQSLAHGVSSADSSARRRTSLWATSRCVSSLPNGMQAAERSDDTETDTAADSARADASYFRSLQERNRVVNSHRTAPKFSWSDYIDPGSLKGPQTSVKEPVKNSDDSFGKVRRTELGEPSERVERRGAVRRRFVEQPSGRSSMAAEEATVSLHRGERRLSDVPKYDRRSQVPSGRFESEDTSAGDGAISHGRADQALQEVHQLEVLPKSGTGLADDYLDSVNWEEIEKHDPERKPLEEIPDTDPTLSEVAPAPKEFAHNIAAYAHESENVRKLVEMGVEVWRMDEDPEMSQTVVTGDWESRIQPHLDFMKTFGVTPKNMARVLSRFPRFLKEPIPELEEKLEYFRSKKFEDAAVARILAKAPLSFSLSVRHIDKQLGALQTNFKLSGDEVRDVVCKTPRLVVLRTFDLVKTQLSMINEMGFKKEEVKHLIVAQPKIFRVSKRELLRRFDYLHNVADFQHRDFLNFPGVFRVPVFKYKERHGFLKSLGKNQYDPTQPHYVSLHDLLMDSDENFCSKFAGQPMQVYNEFKKTL